jgi:hypothetical protein
VSERAGIAARLAAVRARISAAAHAAGRDPESIRLVAVTKKLGAQAIRDAYAAGQRDFGENYVQEAAAKIEELRAQMPDSRWHLVGRLQSNKAPVAVRLFALLHGIDSLSAAQAVARAAAREGRTADVLLQVRLGTKGGRGTDESAAAARAPGARAGVEFDAAADVLARAVNSEGIRFVGLMGVADPDLPARPQFAALRELAEKLRAQPTLARAPLGELSMGMTADLEDAIAEGATIVRIGTAIFGERPRSAE